MSELLKFESVQRWMRKLESRRKGGPSTKRLYLYYFSRFCYQIMKMDPDKMFEERRTQFRSDDELERFSHEEKAEAFMKLLKDENASPNTISTAVGAVRSFYRANRYPLVDVSAASPFALRHLKVPTKEELAVVVNTDRVQGEPWLKAWILCQAESGISNVDLLNLDLESRQTRSIEFGTIGSQLKDNRVPLHLHFIREKTVATGLGYYDSFFGKNAVAALRDYVDYRQKRIFNLTNRDINIAVKKSGEEAGISSDDTPFTPYALRKYFNTRLKEAQANDSQVEYWMGHSLGRVKGAYFVPSVPNQVELYKWYYPFLDVSDSRKLIELMQRAGVVK